MGTYDTYGGTPIHNPAFDFDPLCGVCSLPVSSCECPECPVCGEAGNPVCYEKHGLKRNAPPHRND
jgi:hypothetical protein